MSIMKTAMVGTAALGLVLVSTAASAQDVRSGASIPGVVSVKKIKLARTVAPVSRKESSAADGNVVVGVVAGAAAIGGIVIAVGGGDSPGS